jgi:hypothetical protein
MQSHTVRRFTSAHAALLLHSLTYTHTLTTNRTSIISSSGRAVRLGPASNASAKNPRADRSRSPIAAPPERPVNMRPSQPCLAMLLSLMLLAGLAGCGPTSSDNAPSLESRASVGGPPLPKQSPIPGRNPVTPATQSTSPTTLASGNEIALASGRGIDPGEDSPNAVSAKSTKPAEVLEPLVVPAWMAKELDSPDVGTRLRALDTWVQSAPPGADDPLILALENKDERVRARAMELIEQNWARAADSEQ